MVKLCSNEYIKLIDQDIRYLKNQTPSLERDHIFQILEKEKNVMMEKSRR